MHIPLRAPRLPVVEFIQRLAFRRAQPRAAARLRENGKHKVRRRARADGEARDFFAVPAAQPAAASADPDRAVRVLADRQRRPHRQAFGEANHMKLPVAQAHQPATVHARPDAAVAALEPRAHTVARQAVQRREPLEPSVRRDVKQPVAIMVEPHAAVAILVHAHRAAGGPATQAAPFDRLRHPRATLHFAQAIAVLHPQRARLGGKQQPRHKISRAVRRCHVFKPGAVPAGNFVVRPGPDPAMGVGRQAVNMRARQAAIPRQFLKAAVREPQDVRVARQEPQAVCHIRAIINGARTRRRRGHVPVRVGVRRIAPQHIAKLRDELH